MVLSGLSGVGKDAVLTGLRKSSHHLEFIVTATTRAKRANEKDGVHYHFLSRSEFQELIERRFSSARIQYFGQNVWAGSYLLDRECTIQPIHKPTSHQTFIAVIELTL